MCYCRSTISKHFYFLLKKIFTKKKIVGFRLKLSTLPCVNYKIHRALQDVRQKDSLQARVEATRAVLNAFVLKNIFTAVKNIAKLNI